MNLITKITNIPQYNALLKLLNVPINDIISNKYTITINGIYKLIAHTSDEHKYNIEFGKHMYKCYTDYQDHYCMYSFQQSHYKALKDKPHSDNLVDLIIIGMCSNLTLDEVDSLLKSKGVNKKIT